ncbi:MAG: transposase [Rhodothermaceae bacterium]|nr:transposase [Rhodothermaceae bacterium]
MSARVAPLRAWRAMMMDVRLHNWRPLKVCVWIWGPHTSRPQKHGFLAQTKRLRLTAFIRPKYIGNAVDEVRRRQNRELRKQGIEDLIGTKYDWLTNRKNLSVRQKKRFQPSKTSSLKTARAWAIKELSQKLWHYVRRAGALKAWKRWVSGAMRCRLEPMKKAAKTIKTHLWGIMNAIMLKASNGPAESINSRIETVKIRARGFRNKQRFANAIYVYLGGLDLYPARLQKQITHS